MGRAIFISYRREDSEGEAGRLFDDLVREFGDDSVFMDVAGINPGVDFRKAIEDNVSSCGVLLAVIGPTWATIADSGGTRRLDDANDYVKLEIAAALGRNVAVIPVLVHESTMPHPEQLPDPLKDLAYRNSVEVTHARWNSDVQLLIGALRSYVTTNKATQTEPVHATVSVQLPPPNATVSRPDGTAEGAKKSRTPLVIAGVALAVLLTVAAMFLMRASGPSARHLIGVWKNGASVAGNGLTQLEISKDHGVWTLHAYGACAPVNCDWGTQTATPNGQSLVATWIGVAAEDGDGDAKSRRDATVTIKRAAGDLDVLVHNTYPRRAPVERRFTFVREK